MIIVTGGAGFIGSNIVKGLNERVKEGNYDYCNRRRRIYRQQHC